MTRKEKHMMMLDLAEEFLDYGGGELTREMLVEGIRYARGRGECPAWWAEVAFEMRSARREDREDEDGAGA